MFPHLDLILKGLSGPIRNPLYAVLFVQLASADWRNRLYQQIIYLLLMSTMYFYGASTYTRDGLSYFYANV